jgi:hypothetical protein
MKVKVEGLALALLSLSLILLVAPAVPAQEPPPGGTDEFQRSIIFYNDLLYTIWPVIQAPQDANCTTLYSKDKGLVLLRIHVNSQTRDRGIPPGESVTVVIPKTLPSCSQGAFYTAARIAVLVANAKEFEAVLKKQGQYNQLTTNGSAPKAGQDWWVPYDAGLAKPICGTNLETDPCWIGWAEAAYPLDAPAQLLEYTIISQNAKGEANANPNDDKDGARSFLDFDVSYVDEVYLPAQMAPDTGATQYMGSGLDFTAFQGGLNDFLGHTTWPQWAAYADLNFTRASPATNRTAFAELLTKNGIGPSPRLPSGLMVVENSRNGAGSVFYIPSYDTKANPPAVKACFDPAVPPKANLQCQFSMPFGPDTNKRNCCPQDSDSVMLGCCDAQNFLIDKVTAKGSTMSNDKTFTGEALRDLTSRWTKWTGVFNCEVEKPSSPVVESLQFCKDFKRTAKFAWNEFARQDANSAKPECKHLQGNERDECLTAKVVGYKIDSAQADQFKNKCKSPAKDCLECCPNCPAFCTVEKQLNESVQALLRGVPWNANGDPATCALCPSSNPQDCDPAKCVWVTADSASPAAKLYHFDGFLHFWAPYDSVYNLNPYARVVHVPGTRKWAGSVPKGLDAPGAYSFSIDDFYGNFGGPGTNLIVAIGKRSNATRMPNPEPYDPYTQYFVSLGPGWDHIDVCGRPVKVPQGQQGGGVDFATPFSFYTPQGQRMDPCVITVFDKDGKFVKYKLNEVGAAPDVYDVDDTYLQQGNPFVVRTQPVRGLGGVSAVRKPGDPVPIDAFCMKPENHTAPESKCTGNLAPVGRGNRDAYNSVEDHCPDTPEGRLDPKCGRPLVKFSVPARFPD